MNIFNNIALLAFIALPHLAMSQTAIWEMKPVDCSSLSRIAPGLYQMEANGKKGVVDNKGNAIVKTECTDITPFYEGKALLVSKENGKNRVLGYLTAKGKHVLFTKPYFAINGQDFYSDGMLTVEDEEGRKGYLDGKGNEIEEIFSEGYDMIKHFCEGYAAVFKNRKYYLIDKSGQSEHIVIGVGEVKGGTNVFQGEAYVFDEKGTVYVYNVNTKIQCEKSKRKFKKGNNEDDYLFRFTTVSGMGKEIPYDETPKGKMGLTPIQEGGKFGYRTEETTILPPQFDFATTFEDGMAVVAKNGQYGILKWVDQVDPLSVQVEKSHLSYYAGSPVECGFNVNVSNAWQGGKLQVDVSCGGLPIPAISSGAGYAFKYVPKSKEQTFDVEIAADGLTLCHLSISYTFEKRHRNFTFSFSPSSGNISANENGLAEISITVTNPNNEHVKSKVTINAQGKGEYQFPPNGSQTFSVLLQESRTVEIKTDYGNSSKSYNLSIKHKEQPAKNTGGKITIDDTL